MGLLELAKQLCNVSQACKMIGCSRDGFLNRPGAPILSPAVTTYADMLDPASTDERRRRACAGLLPHVRRQADLERWRGEEERARGPAVNPYGREWVTTERGAALETVAEFLEAAVAVVDAADGHEEPDEFNEQFARSRGKLDPSIPLRIGDD